MLLQVLIPVSLAKITLNVIFYKIYHLRHRFKKLFIISFLIFFTINCLILKHLFQDVAIKKYSDWSHPRMLKKKFDDLNLSSISNIYQSFYLYNQNFSNQISLFGSHKDFNICYQRKKYIDAFYSNLSSISTMDNFKLILISHIYHFNNFTLLNDRQSIEKINFSHYIHLYDMFHKLYSIPKNLNTIHTDISSEWLTSNQLYSNHENGLKNMINHMRFAKLSRASTWNRGTQLKLMLKTDKTNISLIMKAKRYERNETFDGFQGADRHNAEIATFYINRLLEFNKVPLTTGRFLNISEIQNIATKDLSPTFFTQNDGKLCFYGRCYYCNKNYAICSNPASLLEVSLNLQLPLTISLQKVVNPWIRTYQDDQLSLWEYEPKFCHIVYMSSDDSNYFTSLDRLLELIDAHIMDFLVGNSDRHHVEFAHYKGEHNLLYGDDNRSRKKISTLSTMDFLVLLDNGKAFGTYKHDELSILAPLYQCCVVRRSTWQRLLTLAAFDFMNRDKQFTFENITHYNKSFYSSPNTRRYSFGILLKQILDGSEIIPQLLLDEYYQALDRRLYKVLSIINYCYVADRPKYNAFINETRTEYWQKMLKTQTNIQNEDNLEVQRFIFNSMFIE